LYCLQKEDVSGDIRIADLMADSNCPEQVSSFLKRVQDVAWNRKAFLGGAANELFGLAPRDTIEGDLICVLYGCSVPVILREQESMPPLGLDSDCANIRKVLVRQLKSTASERPEEFGRILTEPIGSGPIVQASTGTMRSVESSYYSTLNDSDRPYYRL